ncbi:hypothetical protein F503_00463 [Ophiostoma piceae UAMH 11346]|uniref:Uncharacterized protein n=1 Tax=Ophiostoma piceae (strain UAMH 11346) TaxID=1262450 RepID=S3C771_OPHP1|nr:hypothetical protein F503_00463 [Ophiostoma piceae UAMH 11346]
MNQLQRLVVRSAALPLRASPLSLASRTSPWSSVSHPTSSTSSTSTAASVRMASTAAEGEPAPPLILPYKAKKVWPPDFTLLSPQEQLRFEKRYKRRVAIRSERPRWNKFVNLGQLFSITFVVIYGVLFMEWDYGPQPFAGVRVWFWDTLGLLTGRQGSAARKAVDSDEQRSATR